MRVNAAVAALAGIHCKGERKSVSDKEITRESGRMSESVRVSAREKEGGTGRERLR